GAGRVCAIPPPRWTRILAMADIPGPEHRREPEGPQGCYGLDGEARTEGQLRGSRIRHGQAPDQRASAADLADGRILPRLVSRPALPTIRPRNVRGIPQAYRQQAVPGARLQGRHSAVAGSRPGRVEEQVSIRRPVEVGSLPRSA